MVKRNGMDKAYRFLLKEMNRGKVGRQRFERLCVGAYKMFHAGPATRNKERVAAMENYLYSKELMYRDGAIVWIHATTVKKTLPKNNLGAMMNGATMGIAALMKKR